MEPVPVAGWDGDATDVAGESSLTGIIGEAEVGPADTVLHNGPETSSLKQVTYILEWGHSSELALESGTYRHSDMLPSCPLHSGEKLVVNDPDV